MVLDGGYGILKGKWLSKNRAVESNRPAVCAEQADRAIFMSRAREI
jgi:hypothetical protein